MAKRIWDKGEAVDQLMHELTVGDDPELDRNLVSADAIGSAAHARMLLKMGILKAEECRALLKELAAINEQGGHGSFVIPRELEDVHSSIEARLIETCGEAGRRIHTARSRNDQVLLATRLYLRRKLLRDLDVCLSLADTISARFAELVDVLMPGYTHMQPAMPSSFGMWLHAWYEGLLELATNGLHLLQEIDSNPLGSGAGFGSSLEIDRTYVAKLLGFARVQRSFIDVNNSRGRYEARYCSWASELAGLFEKFACDVMLFTTREFGFIALPAELTTGSSIMPQKRNPDIAELLRARASKVRGCLWELQSLTAKLPSSYNRDLQYTKAPMFRAAGELDAVLQMAGLIMARFSVNKGRVADCMHDELYATYDACREVTKGQPFRDAYRATAERVKTGKLDITGLKRDFELPQKETKAGMKEAEKECSTLRNEISQRLDFVNRHEAAVFEAACP